MSIKKIFVADQTFDAILDISHINDIRIKASIMSISFFKHLIFISWQFKIKKNGLK